MSNNNLPDYLRSSLQKSVLLSEKEELDLAIKIQQQNCSRSKTLLIKANFKLVAKIAGGFQGCGLDIEDLVQEGNLGLIKAAERFDPSKGFRFSTYATWWIRQSILLSLDEKARTVRIPGWLLRLNGKIRKIQKQAFKEKGVYLGNQELANLLNVDLEKLETALMIAKENPSLDYLGEDGDSPFLDSFLDEKDQGFLDQGIFDQEFKKLLLVAFKTLDAREKAILTARFDLQDSGESETLQHIGEKLGVTNERVRQIEKRALLKLKQKLGEVI